MFVIEKKTNGEKIAHRFESKAKESFFLDGKANSTSEFIGVGINEFLVVANRCHGLYNHPIGGPRKWTV